MNIVGELDVESIFKVIGRGVVVAGRIVSGTIKIGDFIDVEFRDGIEQFEISDVGPILTSTSNPDPYKFGLLIKNLPPQDAEKLKAKTIIQKRVEIKRVTNN